MKASAIVRIVIYTLVFLILLGLLLAGILVGKFISGISSGSTSGNLTTIERTVDASEFSKLEIEWAAGSIKIITADTDKVTIKETKDANNPYVMVNEFDDDTLKIRYANGASIHFGSLSGKDLTITVPQSWSCEELSIDGAALKIDITDLNVDTIELDGAATQLRFSGSLRELECDGAAAELELTCSNAPERISVDGAACKLNLMLPSNCGFAVCTDGLAINFASNSAYTVNNGVYTCGDGYCQVRISGLGCSVTVDQQ